MKIPFATSLARTTLRAIEYTSGAYAAMSGVRQRFCHAPPGCVREGKGRLTTHRGWRFLHLEGSPEEMGWQQGRLLGPMIRDLLHAYLGGIHFLRRLDRAQLAARGRALARHIPAELAAEMRAVAAGANLEYEDILIGHTFLESAQTLACSCYAAHDSATASGRLVFGRNLEFPSLGFAHLAQIVTFWKPRDGIPFVSVGWPGWCGTLTAVNLEGLCIGPLAVSLFQRGQAGQPYVILFRRMAQHAATVDAALRMLEGTPRSFGNNVLLAQTQPGRKAVVAEYTRHALAVREPHDNEPFILATNHFRKLSKGAKSPSGRGYGRYAALRDLMTRQTGRITLDTEFFAHPRVHLPNSLHCLVAEPERRGFRLAMGVIPAPCGPYRSFSYDESGIRQPGPSPLHDSRERSDDADAGGNAR